MLSDKTKLIKVRNPWGKEKYSGPWSDKSELWTDKFREEVGFKDSNDGIFWTDLDTYFKHFSETWVNYKADSMSRASFLMLNDDNRKPSDSLDYDEDYYGVWSGFCGSGCTRHKLTLKSTVDQKVFLTGHTWDDRGIADECEVYTKDVQNALYVKSKIPEYIFVWDYGSYTIPTFNIKAGESVEIELEWNF